MSRDVYAHLGICRDRDTVSQIGIGIFIHTYGYLFISEIYMYIYRERERDIYVYGYVGVFMLVDIPRYTKEYKDTHRYTRIYKVYIV